MKIWWTECFNRLRSVGYFVTEDGRVINVPIDWTHNFLSEGAEKQLVSGFSEPMNFRLDGNTLKPDLTHLFNGKSADQIIKDLNLKLRMTGNSFLGVTKSDPEAAFGLSISRVLDSEGTPRTGGAILRHGAINFVQPGCFMKYNFDTLKLGDNTFNVGGDAFNSSRIQNIEFGARNIQLSPRSFTGCQGLKSVRTPKTLRVISNCAFSDCEDLESVYLEDGLEVLGDFVFENCKNLRYLRLPRTLTRIGTLGLWRMRLDHLVIPESHSTVIDHELEKQIYWFPKLNVEYYK